MTEENVKDETGQRLWRIALEQELLNAKQVKHCRQVWTERRGSDEEASLGDIMVELGYLTPKQLTVVRAEERRRRLRVHGYEILDKVGSGAVGTVYRARQMAMERIVALKILHAKLAKHKQAVDKYISEARAVAKLSHPHIVQGIDVGVSGGCYFFAMEFLSGGTFAELLKREGVLDEEQALVYLYQVASALDHAWKQRIIHCDLKPGNLMLDEAGRLKVTDLGLAQVGEGASFEDPHGRRVVRGTPHYVSPEQIESPDDLDCRTDIYALGVTFYQLLSGALPYKGKHAKEIIVARLKKKPVSLAKRCPDLPEGLVDLIHRMMARDREQRPQAPKEIQQAVIDLGVDMGATGDLVGAIQKRRSRRQTVSDRARSNKRASQRVRKDRYRRVASRSSGIGVALLILFLVGLIWLAAYKMLFADKESEKPPKSDAPPAPPEP